jgi:hypothetical protein
MLTSCVSVEKACPKQDRNAGQDSTHVERDMPAQSAAAQENTLPAQRALLQGYLSIYKNTLKGFVQRQLKSHL